MSQGSSKALFSVVDALEQLSGSPFRPEKLISSAAGVLVVNNFAVSFLQFSDSLLLNTTSFAMLRMLLPRAFFGRLPLWKSPSQRLFPEEPTLRRQPICTQQGPCSWRSDIQEGVCGFVWVLASLELLISPSHGQCDGSCSSLGRSWGENKREWASSSCFLPYPGLSCVGGSGFLRVSFCQTHSQCDFIWHSCWYLYIHTCTHTYKNICTYLHLLLFIHLYLSIHSCCCHCL